MPPLTLEQVLARSMRLPRKHMKQAAAPSVATQALPTARGHGEKSVAKLFSLIEKDEEASAAARPSIHRSRNLIRNSQDLLTYLQTAKRMRAWEDALRFFSEATKLLLIKQPGVPGGALPLTARESDGITANVAHLTVLLDTCAAAKQWHLVEQIGEIFRKQSPQTLVYAVSLLASTKKEDVGEGLCSWSLALNFLQTRIPPEEQPVEAYNACLAACEKTLEWEGAFSIVRSMGPNALQNWDFSQVSRETKGDGGKVVGTTVEELSPSSEESKESLLSTCHPPKPNVVSYATLISILEQSGKNVLASEVLQRLPPLEKEEITATYAALILVWSEQKYRNNRFRC